MSATQVSGKLAIYRWTLTNESVLDVMPSAAPGEGMVPSKLAPVSSAKTVKDFIAAVRERRKTW